MSGVDNEIIEVVKIFGSVASACISVLTFLALIIKPFREKILGIQKLRAEGEEKETQTLEATRCLLRNAITRIYFVNYKTKMIQQYEFENLTLLYKTYHALGGNSFVDKIYREINDEWQIVNR